MSAEVSPARLGCRLPSSCSWRVWFHSRLAPTLGCWRVSVRGSCGSPRSAALVPIERLIEPDRTNGVLDQLALHGIVEESVVFGKIAAHWLTFVPLLLVAAVPASVLLAMNGRALVQS